MATPTPAISKEDLAFLQHRVARFGLLAGDVALFGLVFRIVSLALAGRFRQNCGDPTMIAHAVGTLCFFVVWWLCRRGTRSFRFVRNTESIGLVCGCLAFQTIVACADIYERPDLIVALILTYCFVARAVYVPSRARRTLTLGIIIGIPFVILNYYSFLSFDPGSIGSADGAWSDVESGEVAAMIAGSSFAWWTMSVVVGTAASEVIYGLRRRVKTFKELGQYTIEEKIGEGGMGTVYRARHAMLRRPTAVKLLPPEKIGEETIARFEQEVQLTARLTHPNTITIYDYGRTPDGVFYYAMELLNGATLAEIVQCDGPQSPARVVAILDQAAAALAEAHRIGLIHRDIKPANIMLCEQGGEPDVIKVLDFGLVKDINPNTEAAPLTREQSILGTPQYMSPESIRNSDDTDARSDIYALGAIAYYLVTGHHVFDGDSYMEICSHHLQTEPTAPTIRSGLEIPECLEQLILGCLAKDPARRPQTCADLRQWLHRCTIPPWTESQAVEWWERHRSTLDDICGCAGDEECMKTFFVDFGMVAEQQRAEKEDAPVA